MCTYPPSINLLSIGLSIGDRLPASLPKTQAGRAGQQRSTRRASVAARLDELAQSLRFMLCGLAVSLALAGCAARPPTALTPLLTLSRYREALERDDPKAAYALLGQAVQQSLPYDQFAQQWQDTKAERSTQAAQLSQVLGGGLARVGAPAEPKLSAAAGPVGSAVTPTLTVRAVVTLPQGAQLILAPAPAAQFVAGQSSLWRGLDPDLRAVRAQTPEAALRLLLAAAEQRNYPALLRLLTKSERQSLEAELTERIERLRANLSRGQPIETTTETTTDRARIQYDPRFFIDLRREQDGWRIADFN
jgi:hypothetical protein